VTSDGSGGDTGFQEGVMGFSKSKISALATMPRRLEARASSASLQRSAVQLERPRGRRRHSRIFRFEHDDKREKEVIPMTKARLIYLVVVASLLVYSLAAVLRFHGNGSSGFSGGAD
jgi:hypothetical protein